MYKNDLIFERLRMANKDELTGICMALKLQYVVSPELISKKYRQAAGHSMMNFMRSSHALPYKRILIDVADKLKPGPFWTSFKMDDNFSEIDIEENIVEYANARVEKWLNKLTPEQRERATEVFEQGLKDLGVNQAAINATVTAFTSGSIGAALATPAAMSVFYTGGQVFLSAVFGATIVPTTLQVILTGTGVGIAVAAPLLAVTLGGPAYRKIIPATMRLIAVRKRCEVKP
jgi:uncharacterized protein YaaW (UPF0174 family)